MLRRDNYCGVRPQYYTIVPSPFWSGYLATDAIMQANGKFSLLNYVLLLPRAAKHNDYCCNNIIDDNML